MLFFRNVQVFWRPLDGDTRVTVALENPGASGDAGVYADRIELQNIKARFPAPDVSAEYRIAQKWGHFKASGMLRRINYDDVLDDEFDLSGGAPGSRHRGVSRPQLERQVQLGRRNNTDGFSVSDASSAVLVQIQLLDQGGRVGSCSRTPCRAIDARCSSASP